MAKPVGEPVGGGLLDIDQTRNRPHSGLREMAIYQPLLSDLP